MKHGKSKRGSTTSEYKTWLSMIQRCTNPKRDSYKHYGGRGIQVCQRWKNSYTNFLVDMGKKPDKSMTLERVNNDLGYTPDNCIWANRSRQVANTRKKTNNTSGFVGVSFNKQKQKWVSYISVDKKTVYLGAYLKLSNALFARNNYVIANGLDFKGYRVQSYEVENQ